MNSLKSVVGSLVGLVLLCLSSGVSAGQSATMTCVKYSIFNQERVCLRYELWVTVTSDADMGRTGGFGIGVQLSDDTLAYWTAAGGFEPYRGGLVQPTEGILPSLPASRSYMVFAGLIPQLCALTHHRSFNMYAGYGSVPPEREAQLEYVLGFKFPMPISADHIRGAYIQADVHQNPWKIGHVYEWKNEWCTNSAGEPFLTRKTPWDLGAAE